MGIAFLYLIINTHFDIYQGYIPEIRTRKRWMDSKKAYRGEVFYFKDSATLDNIPEKKDLSSNSHQYVHIEDGILVIEAGKVAAVGNYHDLKEQFSEVDITDYSGSLITPGFIDTHLHSTQSGMVAAYGEKLLEWLNNYVFPTESLYENNERAKEDINFFLDHLLKNGTTTAACYGPLFYDAADLFFEELNRRNLRCLAGNVLMDKNSPDYLRLSTQENYDNSIKLIEKWHNKGRLSYCISPRFALSCSEEMLKLCSDLKNQYPDTYIQTHLDENTKEVEQVKQVFPWSKHYLDVYDHYGLVTERSIFGHCIHTTEEELALFKQTNAIISWCPLSNNFLGSGLFNFEKARKYTDKITLASDWGGGNSLSMLAVLDDAYKVSMLNSISLPSMIRWYMATLGAAKALQLDDKIGNFSIGKEADFIVISPDNTPILNYRRKRVDDIFELLFIIMTLGDEQNIAATYIAGEKQFP